MTMQLTTRKSLLIGIFSAMLLIAFPPAVNAQTGEEIVSTICFACHQFGVAGAPKLGNKDEWAPRIEKGQEVLLDHALNGFQVMPPRGGNAALTDQEIRSALGHMLKLVGTELDLPETIASTKLASTPSVSAPQAPKPVAKPEVAAPPAPVAPPSAPKAQTAVFTPRSRLVSVNAKEAAVPKSESKKKTARVALYQLVKAEPNQPAAAPAEATAKKSNSTRVNSFNRLMKPPSERTPPPAEDGIHDPTAAGTHLLQHPKDAFSTLEPSNSGNRVDWVKSLNAGKIAPRYKIDDPERKPVVMDLNIVREVKGSMPNVVYPHKQHTQWLDCSNCHPAIFIPQKGANQISMASILMGEKCGVCHGKVAFPVSECRKCHSQDKTEPTH